jgi:hypothetical protein
MKNIFLIFTLFVLSFFTLQAMGQVLDNKSAIANPADDMRVERFRPPIYTIVVVKLQKEPKYPTSFDLQTPHVSSTKINYPLVGEIVTRWLSDHPKSKAVEVFVLPVFPNGKKKYGVVSYIWVVDGSENLNIQMVRNGACEARTVLLDEGDEKGALISKEAYRAFREKVIEAEVQAKKERLGIWAM